MFNFKIIATSKTTKARAGILQTAHGDVETPIFMPVGTLGTVKSLSPEELKACGAQIILSNTYHLYLRPGCEVIRKFNGLHGFMHWDGPILTDSGGFQVFSLANLREVTEKGALFQSHIDGSRHLLTPEKSMEIQLCLGSDIVMCLDECIKYPAEKSGAKNAVEQTTQWAKRCKDAFKDEKHALFGIVQGGMFKDLREMSAYELLNIDFNGYAIGGLSVGEPKELMLEMADFTLPILPDSKPKYIMGVGTPSDIVTLVAQGADMFDCVLPTRNARNGQLFTATGALNISNAQFKYDIDPIESECTCYTCLNYSKAYLRHLYLSKELLAYRLNTIHNVHYYMTLMRRLRTAICEGGFEEFRKEYFRNSLQPIR